MRSKGQMRFRCRRLTQPAILPILTLAALALPPASYAAKWSTSSVPGLPTTIGTAVSCASSSNCVGISSSSSNGLWGPGAPLAYTWNGTSWQKPSPLARPAGATGAGGSFGAVSCRSSGECTAVGNYTPLGTNHTLTLAEHTTNGKEWAIQTTPNPTTSSYFTGVSCPSSIACEAVGSDETGSIAMAEGWNGTEWTTQTVPAGPAGEAFHPSDVSCSSSTNCVLVGQYTPGSAGAVLDRWNGTEWSRETPAKPEGAENMALRGVSCTSSTACTAVGEYYKSTTKKYYLLAESWDGTKWSVQTVPNPEGAVLEFNSVSCHSGTECTAVGSSITEGKHSALAERWNGTEWAIETTPNPESSLNGNAIRHVSCNSNTDCIGVGGQQFKLALHLSGTTWSATSLPAVKATGSSTSCSTATACLATGNDEWAGFVYSWNGTSWASPVRLDRPTGAIKTALLGSSCTSSTACTVVGDYTNSSGETLTWAERWNGELWSQQTTPSPKAVSILNAVSCSSATACVAVGSAETLSGASEPLAEKWNGTEWTVQTVPVPEKGEKAHLYGVSCSSSTECTAVGSYLASSVQTALVERWNGTAWAVETLAIPSGGKELSPRGVSCASATECVTVGSYNNGTARIPLTERWTLKKWAVTLVVPPTEATSSELRAVSCIGTACKAVGYYDNAKGEELTLAERWSGEFWLLETPPNPSTASRLEGASCTSSEACMAFGSDSINESALAERYF
jgi:hypothetical protein